MRAAGVTRGMKMRGEARCIAEGTAVRRYRLYEVTCLTVFARAANVGRKAETGAGFSGGVRQCL